MTLINLIAVIVAIGLLMWLITEFIPMPAKIKQLLVAVVVIFLVLWILQSFGFMPHIIRLR